VSLVAIGVWSGGLALQIRSTFRIPSCLYCHLIHLMGLSLTRACKALTVVSLTGVLFVDSTHAHLRKVRGTYNPILGVCIVLRMHISLVNAFSVLVVDFVLLLTMLTGLLRHAHKCSTGIWKLLYRQVTLETSFPPSC
jgi:hypothetical protein